MASITKEMTIGELLQQDMGSAAILMQMGMHCVGCPSSAMESIEEACQVHSIDVDEMMKALEAYFAEK